LRAVDLCFSEEEAYEFLKQAVPHQLPAEVVASLAGRTEGWAAGLRLVALALQGRQELEDQEQFLDTFTGTHRPVLEYLTGEVLASQEKSIQEFLLETSFLSRLSGSLCDEVTGRSDSAQ